MADIFFLLHEIYSASKVLHLNSCRRTFVRNILERLLLSSTLYTYLHPAVSYSVCSQEFVMKTRLILSFDLCHLKNKQQGGDDVIKHDSTEAE